MTNKSENGHVAINGVSAGSTINLYLELQPPVWLSKFLVIETHWCIFAFFFDENETHAVI
jgi:hypothetical protein